MPLSAKRLAPKQRLTVCKMNALRQLFRVACQPQSDRSGGICRGAPSILVYHTRGKRTSSFWDSIELTIRRGGFGRAELPRLYFLRTRAFPAPRDVLCGFLFFARDKSGRTPRVAAPGREEGTLKGISFPEQRAHTSKGRVNHGFPLTRPAPLGEREWSLLSLKYLSIPTRAPAPTGRGYTRV